MKSQSERPVTQDGVLEEKIHEWHEHHTLSSAAELLGAAVVLDRAQEAIEPARFLVSLDDRAPQALAELAKRVLATKANTLPASEEGPLDIHILRSRLRDDPNNPLAWVDLARRHLVQGQPKRAERAMKTAVGLTPNNRFVIRSAARLFVHLGEPDYAHNLIVRTAATGSDPWLMASEIAVAGVAGRTPEFVKEGRRLLRSDRFPASQTTELASALATIELAAANYRGSRKLFRQSLVQPNANAVGQARWAQREAGIELSDLVLRTDLAFEARAWQYYYGRNWESSVRESLRWFEDEPFSSRPATLASFLTGSVFQDYRESSDLAKRGLVANPDDPGLLNNLAFGLANSGLAGEAEHYLRRLQSLDVRGAGEIAVLATSGLVQFRNGDSVGGRRLYLSAIEMASKLKRYELRARASIFLALEEIRARSEHAIDARMRALDWATASIEDDPTLEILLRRLEQATEPERRPDTNDHQ